MGGCVSSPKRRIANISSNKFRNKSHRKRKTFIKRLSSRFLDHNDNNDSNKNNDNNNNYYYNTNNKSNSFQDRACSNPNFQGSSEEAWFETVTGFESEDEDFQSVVDDTLSQNVSARNSTCDHGRNSTEAKRSISINEISSSGDDSVGRADGLLDNNCRMLPNNCLPCLNATTTSTATAPSAEKRRSFGGSPHNWKKRGSFKLSFKWKDAPPTSRFSSKTLLQRPIAGSQMPFSPLEKKVMDSWSSIEPRTFRVRGKTYLKDKKKDLAPNCAAYQPFGVDVFSSPRKIEHIARFVDLPSSNSSESFPSILVVNAQIPLYPASLFQSETDGEGINLVMYYKINERFSKEITSQFQESIRRLMQDEVEKVKGFPMDTIAPFRERLKILGCLVNIDELHLSTAEKKLMNAYNEKPVLSRPQHEFFSGENYFEIDLDLHRFSYISRKGFEAIIGMMKSCVVDFGLTIQGNKAEELPEQMLCCIRLNGIDYHHYPQLGKDHDSLSSV